MSSLSDFYQAPTSNLPLTLANNDLAAGDATVDAGVSQQRLLRNYSERQLPDLVNGEAARGTFYGGQAGVRADQLKQDVGDQYGDTSRMLNRYLANTRRNGILAATGAMI